MRKKRYLWGKPYEGAGIALAGIPINVVIVKTVRSLDGHNTKELQRTVMHAEVMAIEEANQHEESGVYWMRLFFVTIEPCVEWCHWTGGFPR